MSNLSTLNNHLFASLESLSKEDLKDDELKDAIEKSKAVQGIAGSILNNAKLALEAKQLQCEYGLQEMPIMLTDKR